MQRWGFWDWIGYSALGLSALIEAANTALSGAPQLTQVLPILTGGIAPFLPLMFFVLGSVILIFRAMGVLHGKRAVPDDAKQGKQPFPIWANPYASVAVVGKTFENERVLIDGHSFASCEFKNVTIVYNGTTPPQITNCEFWDCKIDSDNQAVLGVLALYNSHSHVINMKLKLTDQNLAEIVEPPAVLVAPLPDPIFKYTGTVRKFHSFPELGLSADERLWLESVYQGFVEGKRTTVHVLKRKLRTQLSPGFDPMSIDKRLANSFNSNGNIYQTITLFGVWQIDHDTDLIGKADLVVRYIFQIIGSDPAVDLLTTSSLATKINLTDREVSSALTMAATVGVRGLWSGASYGGAEDDFPRLLLQINVGREEVFESYGRFDGMENAIKRFAT